MSVEVFFKQALGLAEPWVVTECDFDPGAKKLVIKIDFERGARFADPESGEPCAVHDTRTRQWEHLKFFEHRTLLEARVPRILGYYQNYTTSSALEAVNGLLQLAKRRARGYRRFENFRAIAYWIAGKLTLRRPASATH
ncbi:transposase [Haloferula luteola]|uniref:Transposase n=1 Tax=Haloferula luteola TaxID=595692 RepID=A0A840VLA5_9BACT|nr:transposase [Haloferula luteola]MBB5353421.1 transposase [Haloferula luteola]